MEVDCSGLRMGVELLCGKQSAGDWSISGEPAGRAMALQASIVLYCVLSLCYGRHVLHLMVLRSQTSVPSAVS